MVIYLVMDIGVVPGFGLLHVTLLGTSTYKSLCRFIDIGFHFSWVIFRSGIAGLDGRCKFDIFNKLNLE